MLSSAVRSSGHTDALTQTDTKSFADASSQFILSTSTVEAQTSFPKGELGVQAGSGISHPSNAETQTAAEPKQIALQDSAAQVNIPAHGSDAGVQAGQPSATPTHAASQTEAVAKVEAVEAEVQATATASASSTQTVCPGRTDVACEAKIEPKKVKNSCAAACQTLPPARNVAAVQTKPPTRTATATQVTPPAGIDRACQAQDDSGSKLEDALKREAQNAERVAELEAQVAQLSKEKEALKADLVKANESAEAFQHMVQTKAFGQMNVTILCPRAECTVSGERVEMDSWNPKRLREEFEREVLPRFTRVFVEEANGASKGSKARSEAVDKAMQDFAETFRERLSAMLSAPNASAAVQAAAATKSGSR